MPFISRELLRISLQELDQGYSPLLIVSLPCMVHAKVPTCDSATSAQTEAIRFGASQEGAWLEEFFQVQGGPIGKPYFMPGTGEWVQARYPGRSLQRRRKDFEDSMFFHPSRENWAIRRNAATVAKERLLEKRQPVLLVALMAWMWRDREITTLHESLEGFISELGLDRDGFLDTIYSSDVPEAFKQAGLSADPLSPADIAELTGALSPPPVAPPLADLVTQLEDAVTRGGYLAPKGLVARVVGGWLVQDIVVLVGPTGTGKTTLARLLGMGLQKTVGDDRFSMAFLEIVPGYDLAQFLGYENLAGEYTKGQFAREVLFSGEPSDPRLVVLDEWNLAQIDSYFAPVLSAVEAKVPLHLPGRLRLDELSEDERLQHLRAQPDLAEGRWRLPEDTMFIATCNSWLEEPETRLPISGPVKRRCRIITMPNVLVETLSSEGRNGLIRFCDKLLEQELQLVKERSATGRQSLFDSHRFGRLEAVPTISDLPPDVVSLLISMTTILLGNPETRQTFTPGILKDLLLACVYSLPGDELAALGQQVADKILHQIQGGPQILIALKNATEDLPNTKEIDELIRLMGGQGHESRIRPLV